MMRDSGSVKLYCILAAGFASASGSPLLLACSRARSSSACLASRIFSKRVSRPKKRRIEFLEFMDRVVADLPVGKEIHAILDNYCIHKKNDAWLAAHPNVFFHFTPTSASWLNQVEVWFGILSRKALRGASFRDIEQLRKAIEDFVAAYGPKAKP